MSLTRLLTNDWNPEIESVISPFDQPTRHFSDKGITNAEVKGRRATSNFVPITRSKKKKSSEQTAFDAKWPQDGIEGNNLINDIRRHMADWRDSEINFSESDVSS